MSIEKLLADLSNEDRANFTKAVGAIGSAFAARTTVEADPATIANLPQVRDAVLCGLDLDIEAAIAILKADPALFDEVQVAEAKAAETARIRADTAGMTPEQWAKYGKSQRADGTSTMTMAEHQVILRGLNPRQRITYARRYGLT